MQSPKPKMATNIKGFDMGPAVSNYRCVRKQGLSGIDHESWAVTRIEKKRSAAEIIGIIRIKIQGTSTRMIIAYH